MGEQAKKPVLGVMPRWRHEELRALELAAGCEHYLQEDDTTRRPGIHTLTKWANELQACVHKLGELARTGEGPNPPE